MSDRISIDLFSIHADAQGQLAICALTVIILMVILLLWRSRRDADRPQ
jgi:hypothetical protein